MNPRIHHPKWYESVGLFSAVEVAPTVQNQPVVLTAFFSQFVVGDIIIKCIPDRWDIATSNPEQINRIREIAERLFDGLLPHSPVSAIGLNFQYTRETAEADATAFIAGVLSDAAARVGAPAASGGELILKRGLDTIPELEGRASTAVKSTDEASVLQFSCNYHYEIKFTVPFQISSFFGDYATKNRADAEASLERLLSAIHAAERI